MPRLVSGNKVGSWGHESLASPCRVQVDCCFRALGSILENSARPYLREDSRSYPPAGRLVKKAHETFLGVGESQVIQSLQHCFKF